VSGSNGREGDCGTGTVYATATSGLAVTFSSTTPSVCTVTGIAAGTCIIAADQAGDAGYSAATQVVQSITVIAALTPPACTLTAAPSSIAPGGSSTLTASCSPAATGYTWTGGTCAGKTTSTCTVTPRSTTTYTVTGTNSAGTGNAASASVVVKRRRR